MMINVMVKMLFQTWINMQSCCGPLVQGRLRVAKWSDTRMHQTLYVEYQVTNKWIAPALVHIEYVQARDMIVKKPHFRMKRRPTESIVSRQLFSTVRSSKDFIPFTLDDISSAVFSNCPNSVAFWYSHVAAQAQFEPYDDVNVDNSIETVGYNSLSSLDLLEYTK